MIGIDMIQINRFEAVIADDYGVWSKYFFQEEWEYCMQKPTPAQHLAGVFAAKEAIMKAQGQQYLGQYGRILIHHDNNGRPSATLDGGEVMHISVSHDGGFAIAIALNG